MVASLAWLLTSLSLSAAPPAVQGCGAELPPLSREVGGPCLDRVLCRRCLGRLLCRCVTEGMTEEQVREVFAPEAPLLCAAFSSASTMVCWYHYESFGLRVTFTTDQDRVLRLRSITPD